MLSRRDIILATVKLPLQGDIRDDIACLLRPCYEMCGEFDLVANIVS